MPFHLLSSQHNLSHEEVMLSSDKAIISRPFEYKHQNLQNASSKLDSSPRSLSKRWNIGLLTPPSSPKLLKRALPRLSLNLERNFEPGHGYSIILLPPITPISPKSFCQNIHCYEECPSDSAMDFDEDSEPSRLTHSSSSRCLDGLSSLLLSSSPLDLPGFPPKNSLLFQIDSEARRLDCKPVPSSRIGSSTLAFLKHLISPLSPED